MRITIRKKLFAGFGAVLLLLAVVGFIGWTNTTTFSSSFNSLYDDRLICLVQLGNVEQGLYELHLGDLAYETGDVQTRDRIKADSAKWIKQIDDNIEAYSGTYLVAEEQDGIKAWQQNYPLFLQARQQAIALFDQGEVQEAGAYLDGEAKDSLDKTLAIAKKFIDVQASYGAIMKSVVTATEDSSKKILVGAMGLALVLGLGLAFFVSRRLLTAWHLSSTLPVRYRTRPCRR